MAFIKRLRAAAEKSARGPHVVANASRLGNCDATGKAGKIQADRELDPLAAAAPDAPPGAIVAAGRTFGSLTILSVDNSTRRAACACVCGRIRASWFPCASLSGEYRFCGCRPSQFIATHSGSKKIRGRRPSTADRDDDPHASACGLLKCNKRSNKHD